MPRPHVTTLPFTALPLAGPDELAVLAIGMFAGIRPAECQRLTWENVHWQENGVQIDAPNPEGLGDVEVRPVASKIAARRLVTIRPVLAAWLADYREHSGPIYPPGPGKWWRNLRALRIQAGMDYWPADGLRHTFCSMDYAHFNDLEGLVRRMGHRATTLIFSKYRRVVKPADAARFWQLTPATVRLPQP